MSATLEELVQRALEARMALAECECDSCLLKVLAADLAVDRVRIESMRSQIDALAAAFLKFMNASKEPNATSNECGCETCSREQH